MKRSLLLSAGILAFSGFGAVAAETGSSERIIAAFHQCRQIADSAQRLACFETTTDKLEADVKSKAVTIVDHQDIQKAKRSLFGFTLPKVDLFAGKGRDTDTTGEFTEIDTTVATARTVENGRAEIRLADDTGAVWETTEPVPFPPHAGTKIRIRQGVMGAYFLSFDSRTYRGMRLR